MVPVSFQKVVLKHFKPQPGKWSQSASRESFWSISGASPESHPRRRPQGRFGAFQAPARKVVPVSFQRLVLKYFRRQPGKWMLTGRPEMDAAGQPPPPGLAAPLGEALPLAPAPVRPPPTIAPAKQGSQPSNRSTTSFPKSLWSWWA